MKLRILQISPNRYQVQKLESKFLSRKKEWKSYYSGLSSISYTFDCINAEKFIDSLNFEPKVIKEYEVEEL